MLRKGVTIIMTEMIRVQTEGLTTEEAETVAYLEYCMSTPDEKGMLARVIYDMLAFGNVTPYQVASIIGAYDPDGIELDDDGEEEFDDALEAQAEDEPDAQVDEDKE